jgi:porin
MSSAATHSPGKIPLHPGRSGRAEVAAAAAATILLLASAAAKAEPDAGNALAARASLTGDWGGLRTEWALKGVEIGITHTGDVFAVVEGGAEESTYYSGLLDVGVEFDLEALLGWSATRAYVLGIGTFGRDPGDGAGSVHAPSNLANIPTGKVLEAWLEREFMDGRLAVLGGLYGVDSEFDVKETAGVFMNGGFGTGLDLSETGLNGPCVYPTTCLGVRARYQPDEARYIQFAVLDGVAGDPDQPHGTQISLNSDDGLLVLGEAGFQRGAGAGRFLRAAVGAWAYTTDFEELLPPTPGAPAGEQSGTQGVYALLEGDLYREPGQYLEGLSGFLRVGVADEAVNPIGSYAGAGLVYTGLFPNRSEDVLGLGVSAAFNGDDFKDAQAQAGAPVEDAEVVVELTYWMPLLPWFSLQLGAQYISNPATDPALDDALLLGLRYQVTF